MNKAGYITDYRLPMWLIVLHVVLGVGAASVPLVAKLWGVVPLILGGVFVVKNRDQGGQAALWAAYYVGLEVLLRVTGAEVSWEFGKYAVMALLGFGLFFQRRFYKWSAYWVFGILFLLLPGVVTMLSWSDRVAQGLSANLSGLLCLCASVAYFYKRPTDFYQLKKICSFCLLPLISLVVVLFVKTPDIKDIVFVSSANFETSGGFGPNQVATALGFGWLIILLFNSCNFKITNYRVVDMLLLICILFRSFFTFSRGGNFTSILAIVGFLGVHILFHNFRTITRRTLSVLFFFVVVSFATVTIINNMTDHVFGYRFTGKNTVGEAKENITTNRIEIFSEELDLFKSNIFGYGVGGSAHMRSFRNNTDLVSSHNEFGRLLSEHGIFGLYIILMLIYYPASLFFRLKSVDGKAFLVFFVIVSFGTMMHSAMRLALPAFCYGLSMIYLYPLDTHRNGT